jgi:hypothetical protein
MPSADTIRPGCKGNESAPTVSRRGVSLDHPHGGSLSLALGTLLGFGDISGFDPRSVALAVGGGLVALLIGPGTSPWYTPGTSAGGWHDAALPNFPGGTLGGPAP